MSAVMADVSFGGHKLLWLPAAKSTTEHMGKIVPRVDVTGDHFITFSTPGSFQL